MSPPAVIHDLPEDDTFPHESTERCICGTSRAPLEEFTRDDGFRTFVVRHTRLDGADS